MCKVGLSLTVDNGVGIWQVLSVNILQGGGEGSGVAQSCTLRCWTMLVVVEYHLKKLK